MNLRFDKRNNSHDLFVKELFFKYKTQEFNAGNWPKETLLPLLEMQFNIQSISYKAQYPNAGEYIIYQDELPVGWLILDKTQVYRIVNIIVHDSYRGKNIGSETVRKIMDKAAHEGKKVTLAVEKNNPAQRLYSRLGLKIQASDELFLSMST